MSTQIQETQTVTIAGATYTVENWSGMTMLISKKGTAYNCEEGIGQPHSFPGGTPLRKQGNRVLVMNVGGFIEEVKK
ncbi:hypothetical protein ACIGB6_09985 [Paeniglutamicibacter gangotriensis]|uniref:hypothetical protein n=1 Tax=Paeniglutamicibacter gangotriensis TaxID=254787 RepID=UPI0037C5C449